MSDEIKVTTIPATGYYSCGTYTDSNGNTFSHLQWYGEELPDNYDGSGNLWFFKEGEEELAETIIIYDPEKQLAENEDKKFEPEPSAIELETLTSVRNRLFKLYNHVDENTEYDDYSLGLKAAVIEIDKMIENNGKI